MTPLDPYNRSVLLVADKPADVDLALRQSLLRDKTTYFDPGAACLQVDQINRTKNFHRCGGETFTDATECWAYPTVTVD